MDRLLLPALVLAAVCAAGGARAADPTGVWMDDTGAGAIEIKDCSGKLCGHLVWLRDEENFKNCGKQILGDAVSVGNATWDNGWIYDPERKQRFDLEMKPLAGDKLQVMGYAGVKFLSKTMVWTRAPKSLARCDAGKAGTSKPTDDGKVEEADRSLDRAEPAPDAKPTGAPPSEPPKAADAKPDESKRVARAEKDDEKRPRPSGRDEDEGANGETRPCKLEVPYVTLTFPCKD